jgi:ribosome small subunit-dependent GTPase A
MARNSKGKARRRIKNFDADRHDRKLDQSATQESITNRAVKIPAHRLEAPHEHLEDLPKVTGMAMGFYPGGAMVRWNQETLLCAIAKTFRAPEGSSPLAVGDEVTVALTRDEHADDAAQRDKDRTDGFIIAREKRRTLLARPKPMSAKRIEEYDDAIFLKVIAANIDVLMIVAAIRKPRLSLGLIDRFLIAAQRGELEPILVINKIDLDRPDDDLREQLELRGIKVVECSAETHEGLDELKGALAGRRTVLAGASGVGKSTIINALLPGTNVVTRTIRNKDNRGRHTTSATVIYDLDDGGMIVDTPGIRELAMNIPAEELPWYFPEFEPYNGQCHFNNCTHTHEPDCAIIDAVEAGDIPFSRYESYIRLLESID